MCWLGLVYNVVRSTPYRHSKMGQRLLPYNSAYQKHKCACMHRSLQTSIPCSHVIRIGRNGLIPRPRKADPNSMILFPEEKHVEVGTCENPSLDRQGKTQKTPKSSMTNAEISTWSPLRRLSAKTTRKGHHRLLAHFCCQKSWCSHLLYPQKRQMHLLGWHRFALRHRVP